MTNPVTISLDAMSGDHGAAVAVGAALRVLAQHPTLQIALVGQPDVLKRALQKARPNIRDRVAIHPASEVVAMDELPSRALRSMKDSSMRVAVNLVHSGDAHACVSAGNTGALMAISRFVLKTLPGIDRPAIISAIPSIHGHTHMLDLGANTECSAEQLFQFAVMGSTVAEAVHGLNRPRIGLLNIGEEEIKGHDALREAATLLSASRLNYIGFVEGDDIFVGDVDVVVCDGFAGNVALKTSEGLARLIKHFLMEEFSRNPLKQLSALAARPALKGFANRIDPSRYNGASFVGLKGVVIKSHGSADVESMANAIEIAILEIEKAVPEKISCLLADLLDEAPPADY